MSQEISPKGLELDLKLTFCLDTELLVMSRRDMSPTELFKERRLC